MPTLMERQLDPAAGYLLQRAVEERGIKVITKANTKAIIGDGKVEAVELDDGTRHAGRHSSSWRSASGPNAALAKEAGLAVNRGIVVDAGMRTSDPDIFALGECAEVDGQVYGLVAPLYEMARVAAAQLAGDARRGFSRLATRRPSSRSPASTCSPPATSPRPRTARRSCCAMPRAASTSASC